MTESVVTILVAAALGVAMGKALDSSPLPQWLVWSLLAIILVVGLLILRGSL